VQHALPDGRSRGARVNEHDHVRAGVKVEGIPRRSGGDVGGNGVGLNLRLLVGEDDSLGGDIYSLPPEIQTLALQIESMPPITSPPSSL
jgi:hypothetical protein